MSIFTRLRGNWLGIGGFLLGVVGIVLSIYFYSLSIVERDLVFLVDPVRTTIIDSKLFPNTSLRVVGSNNSPIEGDVTSIRFYIWNAGKLSIKPENVLKPITLALTDPHSKILDYKILKTSRFDIINSSLVLVEGQENAVRLGFNVLEKDDGLTGQIIFSGSPTADLNLSGVVEGVKEMRTNVSLSKSQYWVELAKIIAYGLALLVFSGVVTTLTIYIMEKHSTIAVENKKETTRLGGFISASLLFIGALLVIGMVLFGLNQVAKIEASTKLTRSVPSQILP